MIASTDKERPGCCKIQYFLEMDKPIIICLFVGLYNIADSVLVSLDILLEWGEHFKLGHPLSNVITAKIELLNKKLDNVCMYMSF